LRGAAVQLVRPAGHPGTGPAGVALGAEGVRRHALRPHQPAEVPDREVEPGLGERTAQANGIGPLIQSQPQKDTVEKIELTKEQLTPPKPDLEEEAAAYISSHHKALALIGRRLQLELLREHPLAFAWVGFLLEVVFHSIFGLGSKWGFRMAHKRSIDHWQRFLARRKNQAIPKLAEHRPAPARPGLAETFRGGNPRYGGGRAISFGPADRRISHCLAGSAWLLSQTISIAKLRKDGP